MAERISPVELLGRIAPDGWDVQTCDERRSSNWKGCFHCGLPETQNTGVAGDAGVLREDASLDQFDLSSRNVRQPENIEEMIDWRDMMSSRTAA